MVLTEFKLPPQLRRIVDLAAMGKQDKEIRLAINVTKNTLKTYWTRIREKTESSTRGQVIAKMYSRPADPATNVAPASSDEERIVAALRPRNDQFDPQTGTWSAPREVHELLASLSSQPALTRLIELFVAGSFDGVREYLQEAGLEDLPIGRAVEGIAEFYAGRYGKACEPLRQACALDSSITFQELLGFALYYADQREEAAGVLRVALTQREGQGLFSASTAETASNLGACLVQLDRPEEAQLCFWKALAIYNTIATTPTLLTFAELINIGTAYQVQGNLQLARSLYLQAAQIFPDITDDQKDLRDLATLYNNLGLCLVRLGDGGALAMLQYAHKIREALLGPEHPMTVETRNLVVKNTRREAETGASVMRMRTGEGDD